MKIKKCKPTRIQLSLLAIFVGPWHCPCGKSTDLILKCRTFSSQESISQPFSRSRKHKVGTLGVSESAHISEEYGKITASNGNELEVSSKAKFGTNCKIQSRGIS
ncbi:hypothetical protein DdX_17270 [Ditylenchus destructor]|uniref:Uncharacterized protein n=1 Tax=Ditylenchus destructor TaxID=166010 RepID=A0AAD4QZA8_9BILA|nr:hypothetical protein DdX_17270 [Ditylenchus destructor]